LRMEYLIRSSKGKIPCSEFLTAYGNFLEKV
jgi:hypothetical protein